MLTARAAALFAMLVLAAAAPPAAAQSAADGVACHVEMVAMRDGVRLATEVYLPAASGRHPVVLTRSPYTRGSRAAGSNCDNARLRDFARRGYVALGQDARGRYRSGGAFDPFQQEGGDGYDTVEWAAVQPWSDGRVGIFGAFYVGITTLQAVMRSPPHLVTAVAEITASDYDPADPVPTLGGNLCCGDFPHARGVGPVRGRAAGRRARVHERAARGGPRGDRAGDGHAVGRLDRPRHGLHRQAGRRAPGRHCHNVLDRIVRARYRHGSKSAPSLITPGNVYEYTIPLGDTATVFRRGHRIRLEVSSSNFPHYDRNPNTGHAFGQDAEMVAATQTIFHDPRRPSRVELPVVRDLSIPQP